MDETLNAPCGWRHASRAQAVRSAQAARPPRHAAHPGRQPAQAYPEPLLFLILGHVLREGIVQQFVHDCRRECTARQSEGKPDLHVCG